LHPILIADAEVCHFCCA